MNIFQQLSGWITKICKSSESPIICDNVAPITPPSPTVNKTDKKSKQIYQIALTIDGSGRQSFNIIFPVDINDEQNADIISQMMYTLTNDLGQGFYKLIARNNKSGKVLSLAVEKCQCLINNEYHNGVAVPPTKVFCSQ